MSDQSGFVSINFPLLGKFLLSAGIIGLLLTGISILTGWFTLPSYALIFCFVLIAVSLYVIVVSREKWIKPEIRILILSNTVERLILLHTTCLSQRARTNATPCFSPYLSNPTWNLFLSKFVLEMLIPLPVLGNFHLHDQAQEGFLTECDR